MAIKSLNDIITLIKKINDNENISSFVIDEAGLKVFSLSNNGVLDQLEDNTIEDFKELESSIEYFMLFDDFTYNKTSINKLKENGIEFKKIQHDQFKYALVASNISILF